MSNFKKSAAFVSTVAAMSFAGFAEGERYDTLAYEQKGLIAHYDAIENAGRGMADATCTTWKDLTGGHDDLVFPNGAALSANENGVRYYDLSRDSQGLDHGCWLSSSADIAEAIANKACTIEIVCNIIEPRNDGNVVAVIGGDLSKRFLWVRSQASVCIGPVEYLASSYYGQIYPGGNVNVMRTYSMLCGDTSCLFYRNGASTGISQSAKSLSGADPENASMSFGRSRTAFWSDALCNDMRLYAVRVYDRILTDEEILQNYTVDQARLFEGRYAYVRQFVVESDSEEIGAPSPAYGRYFSSPGEEKTCTVSATVDADQSKFICVGYQLYTNTVADAENWLAWGELQSGNIAKFTFPDEVGVKLVWHWEERVSRTSHFVRSFGVGRDSVWIAYAIEDLAGIDGLDVSLKYGSSPDALTRSIAGSPITVGGEHGEVFRDFEPGQGYFGKFVFTLGDKVVSETDVFGFATTDRLAYWPLNSRNRQREKNGTVYSVDQSSNGFKLILNQDHVLSVADPDAPDGEFVRLDGDRAYLKSTDQKLPFSVADGLTFFFRMKGIHNGNPTVKSVDIFETSSDYNSPKGAVVVLAERKDGQWYLCVFEHGSGWSYANYRCTTPLSDSAWQNVVIVFTKQDAPDCFAVYIDGVRQTLEVIDNWSASMKDVDYSDETLFIGGRGGSGTAAGDLDEFGIYGYALGEDEVVRLTADMAGEGGTLFVEASDAGRGLSQPTVGAHVGYSEGQIVSFERKDLDGVARIWSLLAYDEERCEWSEVKHGYGHCGSFTHMGGKMRLCWGVDVRLSSPPICRWTFDDGTGRNDGSLGMPANLTFTGMTSAANDYLAIASAAGSYASTDNPLQLSSATGITASFWLRNPENRDPIFTTILELSTDFNSHANGSFQVSYSPKTHKWEMSMNSGGLSIEGYDASASDVMMDGEWHHCVFVFRKDVWPNIDFYLDGVKMVTDDAGYNHRRDMTNAKFADGERLWLCHRGSMNTIKADLDNVTISPYSFTPEEVAAFCAAECIEKGKSALTDGMASLVVTAKKHVPSEDLPIPGFGKTCACTAGEKLSFDFTRAPYTVEGRPGRFKLMGWTLYRYVDGKWTVYRTGTNPLVEFVHPGGAVKLELNFGIPGLAVFFK